MLVAALLISNANQIFHFRVLWLGLALQESMLLRMLAPTSEVEGAKSLFSEKSSSLADHGNPSSVEAG
jgi:hypothetical protein